MPRFSPGSPLIPSGTKIPLPQLKSGQPLEGAVKPAFKLKAKTTQQRNDLSLSTLSEEDQSLFREECHQVSRDLFQALEAANADPKDESNWESVRRIFHTIKGSALTLGLEKIATFAEEVDQVTLESLGNPDKRKASRAGAILAATKKLFEQIGVAVDTNQVTSHPPSVEETGSEHPPSASPDQVLIDLKDQLNHWQQNSTESSQPDFENKLTEMVTLLENRGSLQVAKSFQDLLQFTQSLKTSPPSLFFHIV
ncbi:MAG: Hpt domain-containing protein, partial [Verrucomicrobiota bacterium]